MANKLPTLLHCAVIALPILALIVHPDCSGCRRDSTVEPRVRVYSPGAEYPTDPGIYQPSSRMRLE